MNDDTIREGKVEALVLLEEVRQGREVRPISRLRVYRRSILRSLLFLAILFAVTWIMPVRPFATLKRDWLYSIRCFSPDGAMLVTAGELDLRCRFGPLRVWNVERGTELVLMADDWIEIEKVCFSPDGALLAAHEKEGDLVIWNLTTGQETTRFRPETHSRHWVKLRVSPDGRFLGNCP